MQNRLLISLLALCTILCTILIQSALAESTDCTAPVLIVPDGRFTQGSFPQNVTYWYGIFAQAGHSYSVEFVPPGDNFLNTFRPQFSSIVIFAPTDSLQGCKGSSSMPVTPNSGISPVILKSPYGAGRRVSFTAQTPGLHLISSTNVGGPGSYSFRVVDTTLLNPRWNTNSGDTQWGFFNVSEMVVTGVLTLFDFSGRVMVAVAVTIPPNGRATRYTGASDLNLPRSIAGASIFSHNGPPGSILGDAFVVSSVGAVTIPVKFESVSPQ